MKLVIDLENNTETLIELSEADIAQQQIDQISHDTPREITCPFELERLAKKAAAETIARTLVTLLQYIADIIGIELCET